MKKDKQIQELLGYALEKLFLELERDKIDYTISDNGNGRIYVNFNTSFEAEALNPEEKYSTNQ